MKTRFLLWSRSLNLKTLLMGAAGSAWCLDLLNACYFVRYWQVKNYSELLWKIAFRLRGESWFDFDPEVQHELLGVTNLTVNSILLIILLVNSVFYLYLTRRKHWAYQYVLSYCLTAAALCLLTMFEGFPVGGAWEAINLLSIPAYLLLAAFIWSRKSETKEQGLRWNLSLSGF